MASRRQRKKTDEARRASLRPLRVKGALVGAGLALVLAPLVWLTATSPHRWYDLEQGQGRIRWVETKTDMLVEHPLAPAWVRDLRGRGIPWPTDLPLQTLGASFGGGETTSTSAWFLIQSERPSNELWHLDKASVRLTDQAGAERPWEGGTGAVLVDPDRHLQFLYIGVPADLSGTGAKLRFRIARFEGPGQGPRSNEVTLPF